MSKIEIGSTIKIKKENLSHIKALTEQAESYDIMMKSGAEGKKQANKALWEFIHDKYPETEDFNLSLKKETHEILVLGSNYGSK